MKTTKNSIIAGKYGKPIVTDVFYQENNQKLPIVIFCHGYKGFKDWGAWNLMAESFAAAGFFFIKFNFSHNGGTVEQPIDFPDLEAFGNNNYTKELSDLETVIDWICTNSGYKNTANTNDISVIGHSRGGGIVLLKAAEDTRIKKVITLAAVCDFASRSATKSDLKRWKETGVKYVLNGRTKQQMPHYYQLYEDFIANEKRLNIQNAVKKIAIPIGIIHGEKDTSILIEEGEKIHEWSTTSVFKKIENANHIFNSSHPWKKETLPLAMEEVTKFCIDFLKK